MFNLKAQKQFELSKTGLNNIKQETKRQKGNVNVRALKFSQKYSKLNQENTGWSAIIKLNREKGRARDKNTQMNVKDVKFY